MYSPDERRSIRAEMNRDAMPSAKEAKAEHRRHLAEKGCSQCDEDDPDKLHVRYVLLPDCNAVQAPPDPTYVLCDDCYEERETLRERAVRRAGERNTDDFRDERVEGVIFFECGNWEYATADPIEEDPNYGTLYESDTPHWRPTGPLQCKCGADVDEYVSLDEEGA